jgi:hypothetical protein
VRELTRWLPAGVVDVLPSLAFLVFLLLLLAWKFYVWMRLRSRGAIAVATVGAARRARGGWMRVMYSFDLEGDKRYGGGGAWPAWWLGRVEAGQKIGIRYDSKYPSLSRIEHDGYNDWGVWWPWWPLGSGTAREHSERDAGQPRAGVDEPGSR